MARVRVSPRSSQSWETPRRPACRFVLGLTAVVTLGAVALIGCRSDSGEVRSSARSDVATTAPAPGSHDDLKTLVAPDRSEFETELGTVRLACQGSGKVPVVLVAGTDDAITRWDSLVRHLGQHVLVCRFDPSKATRTRSTPARRADALSWALSESGLPAPYVLVGHSLGGLTVRRFGADHPDQLGGALLLDATTPVALASLHRLLTTDGWDAVPTQADADQSITWPDVPLIVLAHDPASGALGGGPVVEMLWTEGQQQYASLSPSGRFEQVARAGHYIDRDRPNLVRNVIRTLTREAAQ